MKITLELETCTIIVQIFDGTTAKAAWSYAIFISKLTGEVIRLTIPELLESLNRAARAKE